MKGDLGHSVKLMRHPAVRPATSVPTTLINRNNYRTLIIKQIIIVLYVCRSGRFSTNIFIARLNSQECIHNIILYTGEYFFQSGSTTQ